MITRGSLINGVIYVSNLLITSRHPRLIKLFEIYTVKHLLRYLEYLRCIRNKNDNVTPKNILFRGVELLLSAACLQHLSPHDGKAKG